MRLLKASGKRARGRPQSPAVNQALQRRRAPPPPPPAAAAAPPPPPLHTFFAAWLRQAGMPPLGGPSTGLARGRGGAGVAA